MSFNWSTFFLEIINFLILVWLIKHFFYKPVSNVVNDRRLAIDKQIAEAKNIQSNAEDMKQQFENRLIAWEEEKRQQQTIFSQELEKQKAQQLTSLEKQLQEEREKEESIRDKKLQIIQHKIEQQALDQGLRFISKLLHDLSSQELENKLLELFLNNIQHFSPKQKKDLTNIYSEEKPEILVTTAYPISQTQKNNIQNSIQTLFESPINCNYIVDQNVIAGIRVNIGSYIMRANLADELSFFGGSANGQ